MRVADEVAVGVHQLEAPIHLVDRSVETIEHHRRRETAAVNRRGITKIPKLVEPRVVQSAVVIVRVVHCDPVHLHLCGGVVRVTATKAESHRHRLVACPAGNRAEVGAHHVPVAIRRNRRVQSARRNGEAQRNRRTGRETGHPGAEREVAHLVAVDDRRVGQYRPKGAGGGKRQPQHFIVGQAHHPARARHERPVAIAAVRVTKLERHQMARRRVSRSRLDGEVGIRHGNAGDPRRPERRDGSKRQKQRQSKHPDSPKRDILQIVENHWRHGHFRKQTGPALATGIEHQGSIEQRGVRKLTDRKLRFMWAHLLDAARVRWFFPLALGGRTGLLIEFIGAGAKLLEQTRELRSAS